MNWIGWIILIGLLAETFLRTVADLLNLKGAGTIPEELSSLYTPEESQRAVDYLKERTHFSHIHSLLFLGLFLLFWLTGGFSLLERFTTERIPSPLWQGVAAIFLIGFFKSVFDLPFSWYSTFVIEEKFGFNRTAVPTFISDRIKSAVLTLVLGTPLLTGILYFFYRFGPSGWIYCWGVVVLWIAAANTLIPMIILPIFNTYTPLEDGELKTRIMDYARTINYPIQQIFLMDGSRRSSKANAFFIGAGRFRRIVLFDTLVEKQTEDEVMAVLAHEMGHCKCHHIKIRWAISVIHSGALFFLLSLCIGYPPLHDAFFMHQPAVWAGLIFFSILMAPAGLLLEIPFQALSRAQEFEADTFAAETTGLGEALISSLKGLSKTSLANLNPHPLHVILNHSHPPVARRIENLRSIER